MPVSNDFLGDDEEVLVDLRPHWMFLFGPMAVTLAAVLVAIALVTLFPHAPVGVAWLLVAMVALPAFWLAGRLARWAGTSLVVTTSRLLLRRGVFGRDLVQLRLERIEEVHCSQTFVERLVGTGRLVVEVAGEGGLVAVDDVRRPRSLQRVLNGQIGAVVAADPYQGAPPDTDRAWAPPVAVPGHREGGGEPTPAHGIPVSRWPPARPPDAVAPTLLDVGAPARDPGPPTTQPGPARPPAVRAAPPGGAAGASPEPPIHSAERLAPRAGAAQSPPPPPGVSIPEQLIQLDDLRRRGILTDAEFEAKKAQLLDRL